MAGRRFLIVIKVVVPNEFFAGGDVAQGKEPDASLDLVDFAVRIAGMVEVSAESFAVDHCFAVLETVEVCAGRSVVAAVGFFRGDTLAGVLDDAGSFTNRSRGIDSDGVNWGWADNQGHEPNFARLRGLGKCEKSIRG